LCQEKPKKESSDEKGPLYAQVVCRARHTFLKVSQGYHSPGNFGKSYIRPDEGEGCSSKQRGTGDSASEGSCPAKAGAAKVRGTNRNRVRRALWDEPATKGKVLYPSQAMSVYPASMYRKTCVLGDFLMEILLYR